MFWNQQPAGAARVLAWVGALMVFSATASGPDLGPLYDDFSLTLAPGKRTEAVGPFWYHQERESTDTWGIPPLGSLTRDEDVDFTEFDFAYPILTFDRYGPEYRWQFFQLLAFAGGKTMSDTNVHRFTLFPIYFQQRSDDEEKNYTALLPIYGHLENRLMRDEIDFVMMPIYVKSRKRDVVTWNYVWPFYHRRKGEGLEGWQFWPLVGHEEKTVTHATNMWGDVSIAGGHEKFFALWPIHLRQTTGIGTTNEAKTVAWLPVYSRLRSPLRDSTSYGWPIGLTITEDREKKYHEVDAPWPLIVFAHGEGKNTKRVWPFFSRAKSPTLESRFYAWPVYKYNRFTSAPLDRERTRILFFLYSDMIERDTESGSTRRRVDCWPFFTANRDFEGNKRLQVLALLEPFIPNNRGIERNYSPVWSLWRSEQNLQTGARSQSLLWNLYRRETAPDFKKTSLLFGLFQYQSKEESRRWRLFYVPFGSHGKRPQAAEGEE